MKRWIVISVGVVVWVATVVAAAVSAVVLHDRLGLHPETGQAPFTWFWSGSQWGLAGINGELSGPDELLAWVHGLAFLGAAAVPVLVVGVLVWIARADRHRVAPLAASAP